jgi:hypothetical protein
MGDRPVKRSLTGAEAAIGGPRIALLEGVQLLLGALTRREFGGEPLLELQPQAMFPGVLRACLLEALLEISLASLTLQALALQRALELLELGLAFCHVLEPAVGLGQVSLELSALALQELTQPDVRSVVTGAGRGMATAGVGFRLSRIGSDSHEICGNARQPPTVAERRAAMSSL